MKIKTELSKKDIPGLSTKMLNNYPKDTQKLEEDINEVKKTIYEKK